MHELSLAQSILDVVARAVPPERRACVRAVRVRVGAAAGVLVESLAFCFDAIARHSRTPGAVLCVVPAAGRELDVVDVEVSDGAAVQAAAPVGDSA